MERIRVDKGELLVILKDNLTKHQQIFKEALAGYQVEAVKQLKAHLKRVRLGSKTSVYVHLEAPTDQSKDYQRVIGMLERSLDTEILLTEQDFKCYVLDDWSWKMPWLLANQSYSGTATAMLAQTEGED